VRLRTKGKGREATPDPATAPTQGVEARPLAPGPDGNYNSWDMRRRRAAEVLLPWVEQTVPLSGRTVLEYGCGAGSVSCAVAPRAGKLIGLDIDPALVEVGSIRAAEMGFDNVELVVYPVEEIFDALRARKGDVDVLLLYAVLEHMTVSERLTLLSIAREVLAPDGVIVVCETPNRLTYFDFHTAQIPFFHLLPDDLAVEYYANSSRVDFTDSMDEAAARGRPAALDVLARRGRGSVSMNSRSRLATCPNMSWRRATTFCCSASARCFPRRSRYRVTCSGHARTWTDRGRVRGWT
jgi:ubiquinone/menaquinone biosynthesis C-methylase UbiE